MAQYQIHQGNNVDTLRQYEDGHFDAIVTDPPYGIEFLGKDWDSNTGAVETWQQCFRVLKPGGHLLAFSAARTYHHLASNIESTGFEIRDQLMWLYASGFPKAQKIKNHEGWKTALKPAHEPIVMARKPFQGSTYANMDTHGVGALNIDVSRNGERFPCNVLGTVEGYQKFFYCPKVSRRERHCGFENALTERQKVEAIGAYYCDAEGVRVEQSAFIQHPTIGLTQVKGITKLYDEWLKQQQRSNKNVGNNHPTVKPVALMRYLINLVTPKHSVILDPFTGSGSTGMAAVELGHTFVGCELDPNYVTIANKRIEGWINPQQGTLTHINTYDRRQDGLESAGIQGIQQLNHRRHNKPNPNDLFEDIE